MSASALSAEEEEEARRLEAVALRAEQRAAERAAQRQQEQLGQQGQPPPPPQPSQQADAAGESKPAFLSKQQREQLALEKLEARRREGDQRAQEAAAAHQRFVSGQAQEERRRAERLHEEKLRRDEERRRQEGNKDRLEAEGELRAIRQHYLGGGSGGGVEEAEKKKKPTTAAEKAKSMFKPDWDPLEDTGRGDANPLYRSRLPVNPLFGRGFLAGIDQREQRRKSNFTASLTEKRHSEQAQAEARAGELDAQALANLDRQRRAEALKATQQRRSELDALDAQDVAKLQGSHWSEKALSEMTQRDWRIFREDYDIRVQGGRAPNPLRFWNEAGFPASLMQAINALGYKEPSPIQRQAIPIGQAFRDVIGIAETGSGKTAAFVLPMLCYLLRPSCAPFVARCADEGPLAVVMAPTRELAQQIDEECRKLSAFTSFKTACIVGGQDIEGQSVLLRQGVHIVIGTPGRMVDCIASNFLVLNQCSYVVLDEADRMIDMGFEGQVLSVLDAMGGLLKSEDEEALERQVSSALQQSHGAGAGGGDRTSLLRVTAMFSATMPVEVERMAKTYLRHPAIIKIGDEDSGKNKRIEQRVVFLPEAQKKGRIVDELRRLGRDDKAIVFVNAKKQADIVGRMLESAQIDIDVLHGGKGQDQREETLEGFRKGAFRVLVATDVAGRGLDIADVSHVFNFDCPAKIENYCHRIGRTGRAGKSGVAVTFLTDGDGEVMPDLKAYLESTGAAVPQQLRSHPSVQGLAGQKRGRE